MKGSLYRLQAACTAATGLVGTGWCLMAVREAIYGQDISAKIAHACSEYFFNSNCAVLKEQLAHSQVLVKGYFITATVITFIPAVLIGTTTIIDIYRKCRA